MHVIYIIIYILLVIPYIYDGDVILYVLYTYVFNTLLLYVFNMYYLSVIIIMR